MRKPFKTLDDVNVRGKTVILRIDINSPYDRKTGKIKVSERFIAHSKTIKELSRKGAKIVILAHQGRKGDPDFIHLNQHAKILTKLVRRKIKFVDSVVGKKAVNSIKSLRNGEIILLDNVRFLPEETRKLTPRQHSKGKLVRTLSPLADIFVDDAFSTSHRSHASIVGFTVVLPSYAGRVMENEVMSEEKTLSPTGGDTFIFGGAKIEDDLEILEYMLEKKSKSIRFALTTGLIGNMCLLAAGYDIGKPSKNFLAKKDSMKFLPIVRKLMKTYRKKILFPSDVAIENKNRRMEIPIEKLPINLQILDIGKMTVKNYSKILRESKIIVMKGPAGVYEKKGFEKGTKWLLDEVRKSKAYSLIGGGDTLAALDQMKFKKEDFSHVSLGGGSLITFLSGKPMPGIEALENSQKNLSHVKRK